MKSGGDPYNREENECRSQRKGMTRWVGFVIRINIEGTTFVFCLFTCSRKPAGRYRNGGGR